MNRLGRRFRAGHRTVRRALIRTLRAITNRTVNKEPKWRHSRPELTTGYQPNITPTATRMKMLDKELGHAPTVTYRQRSKGTSAPGGKHRRDEFWDPITRIVGSLGIFTKIDFDNEEGRRMLQHVVDLSRLQHFHEEQGPA